MTEKQTKEYKSIRKIRSGDKGFKDLSVTCVALANAQGGTIYIGIEDETKAPQPCQIIEEEEITDEKLYKTVINLYNNRETYISAMKNSNQSNAVYRIVSLIQENAH